MIALALRFSCNYVRSDRVCYNCTRTAVLVLQSSANKIRVFLYCSILTHLDLVDTQCRHYEFVLFHVVLL